MSSRDQPTHSPFRFIGLARRDRGRASRQTTAEKWYPFSSSVVLRYIIRLRRTLSTPVPLRYSAVPAKHAEVLRDAACPRSAISPFRSGMAGIRHTSSSARRRCHAYSRSAVLSLGPVCHAAQLGYAKRMGTRTAPNRIALFTILNPGRNNCASGPLTQSPGISRQKPGAWVNQCIGLQWH
jgi:hypothetical protein